MLKVLHKDWLKHQFYNFKIKLHWVFQHSFFKLNRKGIVYDSVFTMYQDHCLQPYKNHYLLHCLLSIGLKFRYFRKKTPHLSNSNIFLVYITETILMCIDRFLSSRRSFWVPTCLYLDDICTVQTKKRKKIPIICEYIYN